ncbi:hypothetical protein TNIN_498261 [Trichonephila inaurata madagascariensis]|uniref:RING-type domain-containing protein n=1 Tax=Trichonephila inaurata madagascariensis TaxID=2747483 RepID=A0A8X6I749_9ARAC|nr:hypothetical protein TNIN_304731 [Trichonephila inaurata madagascariensis]GFY48533.1 hypothetical protein TNIN_498261 [Trichonephila inaurata madagascariensis]
MSETCSICLEEKPTKSLDCGHVFHLECIRKWLAVNAHCPYCRQEIREKNQVQWNQIFQQMDEFPEELPVVCPCCRERINTVTQEAGSCASCLSPGHLECLLSCTNCSVCCAVLNVVDVK